MLIRVAWQRPLCPRVDQTILEVVGLRLSKFPTDRQFRRRVDSKCKREPALAEWTFESQCEGWCRSFDSAGVAPWRGSRDDAAGSIDRPVACLPGMHGSVFGRSEPGESAESAGSTSESGHARGRRDGTQPGRSELSGFLSLQDG